jgi:5-methylcytosine-specific restriction enzyme A
MTIPILERRKSDIEYKKYNSYLLSKVVTEYLFNNETSTRLLDEEILSLDSDKTRGWESWGILQFLGLNTTFKGFFKGYELNHVITLLQENSQDFELIISHLNYQSSIEEIRDDFQNQVENSQKMSLNERLEKIGSFENIKPKLKKKVIYSYSRNPHVVAQALFRAQGKCEKCGKNAPFRRSSNGTPYLEVHHKIPLSEQVNNDSNLDTLENVLALCPNCHRKAHFGLTLDFN